MTRPDRTRPFAPKRPARLASEQPATALTVLGGNGIATFQRGGDGGGGGGGAVPVQAPHLSPADPWYFRQQGIREGLVIMGAVC
jgi:hypothetical protein